MIVGLDEAGAGSVAFDLVSCAIIIPESFDITKVKDSKKMTEKSRSKVYPYIVENAIVYGVGKVNPSEIDEKGMAWARREVFHRALNEMYEKIYAHELTPPEKFIVDGTIFKDYNGTKFECIPKADDTITVVSAASIVAKHIHDIDVRNYCAQNPEVEKLYDWLHNKGYGSKKHLEGIKTNGRVHGIHRYSFRIKSHGE